MLGASHGTLSTDPLLYLGTLGGVALTWGTLYIRVIYPRSQDHKKHEAEREKLRDELARRGAGLDALPDRVGLIEWWVAVHEKGHS